MDIKYPEHPYSLEELKVISEDAIEVDDKHNCVRVAFTPTVEHCSMATVISLCLRVKLTRSLPMRYKVDIKVTPGTHATEAAVEGEGNKEINQLFKSGKKKKKGEKSAEEIALLVENVMAELEVVAEEDVELIGQSKPAIYKLKRLPLLMEVVLSKWKLTEYKHPREQLKKSGLGKVIMFLKSNKETTTNRRMAKDLVDKWS
ncbi:unnamed protein product [Camellia sinensis]